MRDVVRRLRLLRLPATAGKRGLPLTLAAFAVIAGASTAASTASGAGGTNLDRAPAGATVLPPAVPPTYSYPGSTGSIPGVPTAPSDGTASTAGPAGGTPGGEAAPQLAASGIPARAVQAYKAAAAGAPSSCGIPWTLVAAIGRVESNHGRFGGATLLADGRSNPPIVGIPLDGRPGVALIADTDGGKYDGDTVHDRAVGPMQFIPGTWALFAADGDHDGKADPFDIDDAAAAAANYLCRAGGDLSTEAGQRNAVYSYNRSDSYVALVLALSAQYAGGVPIDGSTAPGGTPGPIAAPTLPPGSVGPPPAASPTPSPSTSKPKPKPTTPAPTTTTPTSPGASPTSGTPTPSTSPAPSPTTPAPTTTTPAPTATTPSPSPTCTPAPSPSPSPSGSISPNGTAAAAESASAAASAETATPAGTTSAAATPTATPTPTLPTCPTP